MEKLKAGKSEQVRGTILALMTALLWSTNAPLIKSIELAPTLLAALRAASAGIVLLPFLRPKKIEWGWPVLLAMAVFTVQSLLIVFALKLTSVAVVAGMQYTAPVWLYLIAFLKKEPIAKGRLVPLGVLTAGVAVSMFSRSGEVTFAGNALALAVGVCFALLTAVMKRTGNGNPLGTVCLNNLFMAAALLIVCAARGELAALRGMTLSEWATVIYLGVIPFGAGYVCYNLSLQKLSASRASMIPPLEMMLGPLWVALFLRQYPDAIGLIGLLLITAGVALEILCTLRREKTSHISTL